MKLKVYKGEYDKSEFYSIMGKYFAETKYKKELPYSHNSDEKEWYLFYEGDNLIGFTACEQKKNHIAVSCVYVNEEYRCRGYGKKILSNILQKFSSNEVQMITNNKSLMNIASKHGFIESGNRGSYIILRRPADEKN